MHSDYYTTDPLFQKAFQTLEQVLQQQNNLTKDNA